MTSVYQLPYRVLRLSPQPDEFLNGLTSNRMDAPCNALLNRHGRIIAAFFQARCLNGDYVCLIHPDVLECTERHLAVYSGLSGVQMIQLDWSVFCAVDKSVLDIKEDDVSIQLPQATLLCSRHTRLALETDQAFALYRLKHNWPLPHIDFGVDEFILNVNYKDYVSFTKGCYLGQEPVSKVYNRSKPSWTLKVVEADSPNPEGQRPLTSACQDLGTGRWTGFQIVRT